ncbi:MAG: SCO family protein [Deltaproteobacteria bacterium]|nr:SCO family protein [Deltaproteobacteria bacterium]
MPVAPLSAHLPIPPKKGEIGRKEVKTAAPSFTLTDQNGKPFHFKPASDKLVLVNFIYTTCPDICPLFTAKLAAIQRSLEAERRDNYLLFSITTDPARDTPVKMKEYAEAFKPDFRRWYFLTGSAKELAQVWKDFGVRVRDLGNGQIQHTNFTTLIDGQGLRRVDYYGDKWLEKEVLKDLRRLAGEK